MFTALVRFPFIFIAVVIAVVTTGTDGGIGVTVALEKKTEGNFLVHVTDEWISLAMRMYEDKAGGCMPKRELDEAELTRSYSFGVADTHACILTWQRAGHTNIFET